MQTVQFEGTTHQFPDDVSEAEISAARGRAMNWRDQLKVHPAADLFPMMSEAELRELGEDIKKNGLRSPIIIYQDDGSEDEDPARYSLLDGRNRLDAMALVGIPFELTFKRQKRGRCKEWTLESEPALMEVNPIHTESIADPYEYVISANIHRRHLTPEKRREVIAALLKARPGASDRTIAKQAKVDHKTVAAVRKEKEATGEIPQLEKRTGKDGKARKQPASKSAKRAKRRGNSPKAEFFCDDGRILHGEKALAAIQQAIRKEEEAEERAIAILIEHLDPKVLKEFIACLRQGSMDVNKLEQVANAKSVWDGNRSARVQRLGSPQGNSDDDGLDIPGFLKRDAKAGTV
jgi:hypothetical protein